MRFLTLTIVCLALLLAAPLGASAKSKKDKGAELIAKLLAKIVDSAGNRVSTETEMVDSELMGDGNEIVQIESLTLNITIGDVVINKNSGGDGGGMDIAHRLLDFLGMAHEQMGRRQGGGRGPDRGMHPGMDRPMGGPHGDMQRGKPHDMDLPRHPGMGQMKDGHGKGHPKMGGRGEGHPMMEGHGEMMKGKSHSDGSGFNPEVMEMIHRIPKDIDPEFFGLIMRVGKLAWEHPMFRERLEQMIERVENSENDRRPHGRKDGPAS